MKLTPEERYELFTSLSSLAPPKLSQLLFVLGIPEGIVSPPPAPQGDRAYQLLTWAETVEGCGLDEVRRILRIITGQTASSQTSDTVSFRPFLEISNDDSMGVWDIVSESWLELPIDTKFVKRDVLDHASQDASYARNWKQINTLIVRLYPQYVKLHQHMMLCQKLNESRCLKDSERYRFDAATLFEKIRSENSSFSHSLNELTMINEVELVSFLRYVPNCSAAINQSLGSSPESSVFRNGVLLVERICELLLDIRHVAIQLLEAYFASIHAQ